MAATALGGQVRRPLIRRPGFGGDDDRLVAGVRAGDDTAFEAIYDRYSQGLLAFCRHMLASRDEAEDALQHSFGAAYRRLRDSDSDVELRPWLYTIARNRCLSLLRARRSEISLDAAPAYGARTDGLADEVQRRSDLRELLEDVQRLPRDQRAALVLLELGDLPHEEIATVLGVRREKVKALVFQAREGLMRARRARELPCTEMREQLATLAGKVPRRSMLRRHVDRCPSCALFEAEVGRQRAGLALILPVLPTAGLKSMVLGSAIGRGAAVAGGGAGAGAGAAVLGGAGGSCGGGLTCAAAGSGAAGLAGTGAASGGGILASAATGGVTGSLATAGGAGTIAAALGAKGATSVVAKLLAVVAVGGGAVSTGQLALIPAGGSRPPAVHQVSPAAAPQSPVVPELPPVPGSPATDTPADALGAAPPATGGQPLPLTASNATSAPDGTSPTAPAPAGSPSAGGLGSLPSGDPNAAPPPPTAGETPATEQPPATDAAPAVTAEPATTDTTTTTAAAPTDGAPATTDTTTTTAASGTSDAASPSTADTAPATTTESTVADAPATGGEAATATPTAGDAAPADASAATAVTTTATETSAAP
jgi:RNA polymerase sigma factor (sigma-70 family)